MEKVQPIFPFKKRTLGSGEIGRHLVMLETSYCWELDLEHLSSSSLSLFLGPKQDFFLIMNFAEVEFILNFEVMG